MNEVAEIPPAPVVSQPIAIMDVIARAATDPAVDIDKLERLMQMHERLTERTAKAAYANALSRLQPKLPLIRERGGIKDRNDKIQSKYALWEDVVAVITPILAEEGFSLSFRTKSDERSVTVTGVLLHREGHSEETSLTLPLDNSGSKNNVQGVGPSTSYGKRYTASALLNLRTGDIDDDGGGGPKKTPEPPGMDAEQFKKWQADMEAVADEGSDRLRESWQKMSEEFRIYTAKNHASWWGKLKAKAEQVGK